MMKDFIKKNPIYKWIKKDNRRFIAVVIVFVIIFYLCIAFIALNNRTDGYNVGKISVNSEENFFKKDGFRVYEDNNVIGKKGIDVSAFQGKIDWEKVKESGVEFAIIRCGFRGSEKGVIYEDPKFEENAKGALDAGIEIGAYFFSQAINIDEAIEEANFTVKTIKKFKIKYPVAFDMELVDGNDRISGISPEDKGLIAKTYCDKIKEYKYETMVYGNVDWFHNHLSLENFQDCNIWLADYTKCSSFEKPIVCWQYNNEGIVDGIKGSVDLDVFFVSKDSK